MIPQEHEKYDAEVPC